MIKRELFSEIKFEISQGVNPYQRYKLKTARTLSICMERLMVRKPKNAVPNKNAGFIILLTSIFTFFFFGEIRNLTTLCLLNNNGFSLSSFFLSLISYLWIGAQFPQEKFLSYGRILTLHYYFLLMCILISQE